MKNKVTIFLLALVCLAMAGIVNASPIWTHVYNADVLPVDDGWSVAGQAPTSQVISNGILQLTTNADPSWLTRTPLSANPWTVEWRMRVIEGGTQNDIDLWFSAGGFYVDYSISGVDMFGGPISQFHALDTSVFHTYRMTSTADFYIDDSLIFSGANRAFPSNLIEFGDGTSRQNQTNISEWDYIAWLVDESLSPSELGSPTSTAVPEPGVLTLFGLSLVALCVTRRKKV